MRIFTTVHGWLRQAWPHALGHVLGAGILVVPGSVFDSAHHKSAAERPLRQSTRNVEVVTGVAPTCGPTSAIEVIVETDMQSRVKISVKTKTKISKPKAITKKRRVAARAKRV